MRQLGRLPRKLQINGKTYPIRTDFRDILRIQCAFSDERLDRAEALEVMRRILYPSWREMPTEDVEEAMKQGMEFLNAGRTAEEVKDDPLYSWYQDEQMIMSAMNKVAGYEVRSCEYMHWWTFVGMFNEITDGLWTQVIAIRRKLRDHERLDKSDRRFYNENKKMVDIQRIRTEEEQANIDRLNALLG